MSEKQIREELLDDAVTEVIVALVSKTLNLHL